MSFVLLLSQKVMTSKAHSPSSGVQCGDRRFRFVDGGDWLCIGQDCMMYSVKVRASGRDAGGL